MVCARHAVVVTHSRLRESGTVVEEAVEQLRRADFEVTIIDNIEAPDFGSKTPVVPKNTEIVVVLGGDGTILRAAELVHCTEVPILGVNLGHVGFLAEFESFQMSEAIRRIADHDYSIDERMIAHVDVWLPGATEPIEDWALNDITLERAQTLALQVWGQGFAPPSFTDEFAVIRQQPMGVAHKKVWLQKEGCEFEAMFWRCTDEIPERIRTVYRPVANEWRNNIELQLYIDYWEAA